MWKSDAGFNTAEIAVVSMERAVREVGPGGKVYCITGRKGDDTFARVGSGVAEAWLAHLAAGSWAH